MLLSLAFAATAHADAPLSQGFEDGAPAWAATGMWHVQTDPQAVKVIPAIADNLVTLPDPGLLPAPIEGESVAWFGQPSTGTYCGSDFLSVKQTPQDGCTSARREAGTLTSPPFSLAGRSSAFLVFRGWWEIEAAHADVADLMSVEYSTDGGATWTPLGYLNPLDPAWGGQHQSYSDAGARMSGNWQSYAADLSPAAGHADVQIRFGFDTVDTARNGFRGLLLDGVAIVDPLGATVTEPGAGPFTDAPPSISVSGAQLVQSPNGQWSVHASVGLSDITTHPVTVGWSVHGASSATVATGQAAIAPGQMQAAVDAPVDGTDAPYAISLTNPSGATLAAGGSSSSTPGGSLPVLTLSPPTASANPDGTVDVTVGVSLSQPASVPVGVDYSVVGSDGVTVATGALSVPPGAQTASATITAPANHAPYTVGLSNPTGALLGPSRSTGSTSPLAGSSSLTPPSQLVLGVRVTGGTPTLGQTFLLSVGSGVVRYHTPGGSYQALSSGTVKLPLGSVVDATNGHALITVEEDGKGTFEQAELWEGKFGVFQFGNPAITQLRLAGGDFSVCAGASRSHARRSAVTVVRHLWAQAKGHFQTKGRFASATIRGTRWLTEDLCQATRVTVAEGIVAVLDFRRKQTSVVPAGNSITVGALQSARYRRRHGVHPPKLSRAAPASRR